MTNRIEYTPSIDPMLRGVESLILRQGVHAMFIQTTLEHDLLIKNEADAHVSLVMMMKGAGHFTLQDGDEMEYYQPDTLWLSCSRGKVVGTDFFPRHHYYHMVVLRFAADTVPLVEACGILAPDERVCFRSVLMNSELRLLMEQLELARHDQTALGLVRLESLVLEGLWRGLSQFRQHQAKLSLGSSVMRDRRKLIAARAFIEEHAVQPLTLALIARESGLTLASLKKGFLAMFNITPWDFVIDHRLKMARSLLEGESGSLNDIALQCGFSHGSHLTRFFSRQFGLSPGEYRKRCQAREHTQTQ